MPPRGPRARAARAGVDPGRDPGRRGQPQAVATISKDRITSFVRAPFTEFEGRAGHGEVDEKPRGRGLRRSFGELLTCPYCLAQWVTAGFAVGLVYAPRATRLVATVYTAEAISDFLQLAYKAGEDRV